MAKAKLKARTHKDRTWIQTERDWEQVPVIRRAGPWVVHLAPNSRNRYNVTLDGTGRAVIHDISLIQAVLLIGELNSRNHAALIHGERDGNAKRAWLQALTVARIDIDTAK